MNLDPKQSSEPSVKNEEENSCLNLNAKQSDDIKIELEQKLVEEKSKNLINANSPRINEELKIDNNFICKSEPEESKYVHKESNSYAQQSIPIKEESRKRSESCDSSDPDSPIDTSKLLLEMSNKFQKLNQNK